MGLTKSLLSGIVACIVATAVARAVGRSGTKLGLLTGGSVVAATLLSGGGTEHEIEIEDEIAAE